MTIAVEKPSAALKQATWKSEIEEAVATSARLEDIHEVQVMVKDYNVEFYMTGGINSEGLIGLYYKVP